MNLFNSPAGGVPYGGDWCDAFPIGPECIAISIGDVAGHGEPAAQTMRLLRSAVAGTMYAGFTPSDALYAANSVAYASAGGVIVTAMVGVFNLRRHTLTFASAGHPAPLLTTANAAGFLLSPVVDLPLGIFPKYGFADHVVAVPEQSLIVFYTDGIVEHNRDILRGEMELVAISRAVHGLGVSDAALAIADRVFRLGRGLDDAAIVTLRCDNLTASGKVTIRTGNVRKSIHAGSP